MATYLGLDLGTSGLRALLTDDAGVPLAEAEARYDTAHPRPGWSEQDPALWTAALDAVMGRLAGPHLAALGGIGISGHMHGATLLDGDGAVLRPCILWNDSRARDAAAQLDASETVRAVSGNIVFPGFTAPKLLWVREHEPELFERIATVLLPAAYLSFHLTGERVADMSDSAGTAWLDTGTREWSADLLARGGMARGQMPRLVEGTGIAGGLRRDLAARWSLPAGIPVTAGAGDNAASACGIGALGQGEGFVSLGTSGVLLAGRDSYRPAPETAVHTFCHAVPGRWYQMGVMLSAASCLDWLARITGASAGALIAEVDAAPRPPGAVRFYPYLTGERTPHNDPDLRGTFAGLSAATGRQDMTRAVLEGVCFGLRQCRDALERAGPIPERLFAIGGGSRSEVWLTLLAGCLDTPLARPVDGEFGAAMGAARLARCAATGADPAHVCRPPDIRDVIAPDPVVRAAMDEGYARFRAGHGGLASV